MGPDLCLAWSWRDRSVSAASLSEASLRWSQDSEAHLPVPALPGHQPRRVFPLEYLCLQQVRVPKKHCENSASRDSSGCGQLYGHRVNPSLCRIRRPRATDALSQPMPAAHASPGPGRREEADLRGRQQPNRSAATGRTKGQRARASGARSKPVRRQMKSTEFSNMTDSVPSPTPLSSTSQSPAADR